MDANLLDLGIVLLFSFLGILLSMRLKLPSVIGVLFFGMLIGPNALGLIDQSDLISTLFELGAIFLLFFIGIEFSLEKISRFWLRASFVMAVKFIVVFLFTYLLATFIGLPILDAALMGVILSFSSTAIFARLVAGTPQEGREEVHLMSAVLIIEDIFAVFVLTLIPQLHLEAGLSLGSMVFPVLSSVAILFIFYVGLKKAVLYASKWMDKSDSEPQLFLALSLCAALAFLSAWFGLSPSIGAFFAGSAVATVPLFKKVEGVLKQLFIIFSAFFFFAIGIQVDPVFILGSIGIILLLGAMNVALKFFSISLSTYLAGFGSREAFFAGLIMLTASEFALLVSAEAAGISQFDFMSLSAALIVFSSLAATALYSREAALNSKYLSALGQRSAAHHLDSLSAYLGQIFRQFESGGEFYQTLKDNGFSLILHAGAIFVVAWVFLWLGQLFGSDLPFSFGPIGPFEIAAVLICLYPAYRLFTILSALAGRFSEAFHMHPKGLRVREKMLQDVFFGLFFFLISAIVPFAIALLSLPAFLQSLSLIPMAISTIFFWDLAVLSTRVIAPTKAALPLGKGERHKEYTKLHKERRELLTKAREEQAQVEKYFLAPLSVLREQKKPEEAGEEDSMRPSAPPKPKLDGLKEIRRIPRD